MTKPQKNVSGSIYLTTVLASLKNEDGSTWIEMTVYADDKTLHCPSQHTYKDETLNREPALLDC